MLRCVGIVSNVAFGPLRANGGKLGHGDHLCVCHGEWKTAIDRGRGLNVVLLAGRRVQVNCCFVYEVMMIFHLPTRYVFCLNVASVDDFAFS